MVFVQFGRDDVTVRTREFSRNGDRVVLDVHPARPAPPSQQYIDVHQRVVVLPIQRDVQIVHEERTVFVVVVAAVVVVVVVVAVFVAFRPRRPPPPPRPRPVNEAILAHGGHVDDVFVDVVVVAVDVGIDTPPVHRTGGCGRVLLAIVVAVAPPPRIPPSKDIVDIRTLRSDHPPPPTVAILVIVIVLVAILVDPIVVPIVVLVVVARRLPRLHGREDYDFPLEFDPASALLVAHDAHAGRRRPLPLPPPPPAIVVVVVPPPP